MSARGWSDRFNPIVVKEVRQATRGRFLAVILLLLLTVQVTIIGGQLLSSGVDSIRLQSGGGHGREAAAAILAVAAFVAVFCVPLSAGVRLFLERSAGGLDLVFVTTLGPRKVIAGKVASSMVVLILLLSSSAPFLAFTVFLRGVDVGMILALLVGIFLAGLTAVQATILVASISGRLRILAGITWIAFLMFCGFWATGGVAVAAYEGWGNSLFSAVTLVVLGMFALVLLAFGGLAFRASVALVSPPVANRALPVRRYLSVCWIVSAAIVIAARSSSLASAASTGTIAVWAGLWILVLVLALLTAISAPDDLGGRVRSAIPWRPFSRAVAFLYFSGSANGIAWASLHLAATIGLAGMLAGAGFEIPVHAGFVGFMVGYALLAFVMHRRFFASKVPLEHTWLTALLLVVGGSVLPFVCAVLLAPGSAGGRAGPWLLSNPWAVFDSTWSETAVVVGILFGCVSLLLAMPRLVRQWSAFQAPDFSPELGWLEDAADG